MKTPVFLLGLVLSTDTASNLAVVSSFARFIRVWTYDAAVHQNSEVGSASNRLHKLVPILST